MSRPRPRSNQRSLDEIAADIDALDRNNVFDKGELFLEAKDTHPGEFLHWLEERDYSADTAERCMGVALLGRRFRNLRNLKLGKTTLYALLDEDEDALPTIIDALAKVATKQHLKPAYAREVIKLARLRFRFGDFPEWTLISLEASEANASEASPGYRAELDKALKAKQPTTKDEALQIVAEFRRAHIEQLYGGKLPVPDEALDDLDEVPSERRGEVLQQLLAAPQPVTAEQVRTICSTNTLEVGVRSGDEKIVAPYYSNDGQPSDAGHADNAEEHSNNGQPDNDAVTRRDAVQKLERELLEAHKQITALEARIVELEGLLAHERYEHDAIDQSLRRVLHAHKGWLTSDENRKIRACLHPDWAPPEQKQQYEEAAKIYNQIELALMKRGERPPAKRRTTKEDWDAMKRAATATRKAKRQASKHAPAKIPRPRPRPPEDDEVSEGR
jgi:hypothetical protein